MFEFNGCKQEYEKSFDTEVRKQRWSTEENYQAWYKEHCAQCPKMNEVCMVGANGED